MKIKQFPLLLLAALTITLSYGQTAEKNKAAYLEVIAGFNNHSFDALEKHCISDMMDNLPPNFEEMTGTKGLQASETFLKGLFAAFPDLKFEVKSVLTDDKMVIAYWVMSGTMKGEFMGMKPTGKSFTLDGADVLWINSEGKAFKHIGIQDNMEMMAQLGLLPPGDGK